MNISREDFTTIDTTDGPQLVRDLCGWSPELARDSFDLIGSNIPKLRIVGAAAPTGSPRRSMLFEVARKVLGKDTDNYPQLRGDCYLPGTKVLMSNGQEKDIEKILIGDMVLNHEGKPAKVVDVVAKLYTGDMVTVKVQGHDRTLTATATHDSLTLPYHQYRYQFNGFAKGKFGDYKEQDRMLIPFGLQTSEDITIDVKDHTLDLKNSSYDDNFVYYKDNKNTTHKVNRFIKVDNRLARFVGLYLAEGGTAENTTYFCFNSNESVYIKEVEILAEEIFGKLIIKHYTPGSNCIRVSVRSWLVNTFMRSFIPGKIHTKRIPDLFFRCSKSIKLDVLKGWLDGDGHKAFHINSVTGTTTSPYLGLDMHRLALSCGINARNWTRTRKVRAKVPVMEVGMYNAEPYKIYEDRKSEAKYKEITCNNTPFGFARPISEVTKEYVQNKGVFCITTDGTQTLVVNGLASYNCTSFMGKNVSEYVQLYPIANGDRFVFTPIFPPYLYGCERVFVGGQRHSMSDGGVGAWIGVSVQKYGVLPSNAPNCPPYSKQIAGQWGYSGPPDEFVTLGKQHIIKSAASVTAVEDVKQALMNFYPVGVCSSIGYDMTPRSDGFNHYSQRWDHAMTIIGFDEGDGTSSMPECFTLLNSWGDAHGKITDWRTKEVWPIGTMRITPQDLQKMLNANDSFAFSSIEGFPAQDLPRNDFVFF